MRNVRPSEETQRQAGAPSKKLLFRSSQPMSSPSTAEVSALSPGVLVGSARDLSVWQAVIISCIWRKLATARTSSTFSGLRLSLAVYMNSSTCPRPAKDRTAVTDPLQRLHLSAGLQTASKKAHKGTGPSLLVFRTSSLALPNPQPADLCVSASTSINWESTLT